MMWDIRVAAVVIVMSGIGAAALAGLLLIALNSASREWEAILRYAYRPSRERLWWTPEWRRIVEGKPDAGVSAVWACSIVETQGRVERTGSNPAEAFARAGRAAYDEGYGRGRATGARA